MKGERAGGTLGANAHPLPVSISPTNFRESGAVGGDDLNRHPMQAGRFGIYSGLLVEDREIG
jgi:hypothetical protein